jgi:AraC family transcriptional regulator
MELVSRRGSAVSVPHLGHLNPPPSEHSVVSWGGGVFQRASRPWTELVEGRLTPSSPLLMLTVSGGARRHEFSTDDGLRFDGPDSTGSASFLPAGCERRLRLHGVEWSWASITLGGAESAHMPLQLKDVPAFCSVHDAVIAVVLGEMARVHETDGALDPAYCDTFAAMLTMYLARKFGITERKVPSKRLRLSARQLHRLDEYVNAHLDVPIRVKSLARVLSISEGHLYRALKTTTGDTPIAFVNRRRIQRAAERLRTSALGIQEAALGVGFASPSAFARVFRDLMGRSPSQYRRAARQ